MASSLRDDIDLLKQCLVGIALDSPCVCFYDSGRILYDCCFRNEDGRLPEQTDAKTPVILSFG